MDAPYPMGGKRAGRLPISEQGSLQVGDVQTLLIRPQIKGTHQFDSWRILAVRSAWSIHRMKYLGG